MMTRERFEELTALVMASEATAAERTELDAALANEPSLAAEFAEQGGTDRLLRRVGANEVLAAPMSSHVIEMLERTRRDALSARLAAEGQAGGGERVVAFAVLQPRKRVLPVWLALAACVLLLVGLTSIFLPPRNSSKDIAVLAPRGETGFTKPTLAWDAKPGQRYDAWIIPPEGNKNDAPALYIAKGVQPPVAFPDLKPGPALKGQAAPSKGLAPGQNYRVLICLADAGRIAGTAYPFHVTARAAAGAPPSSLAAAQNLAAAERTSDALAVLASLPPEERARPQVRVLETDLRAKLDAQPKP